jgi:hypothetical protein
LPSGFRNEDGNFFGLGYGGGYIGIKEGEVLKACYFALNSDGGYAFLYGINIDGGHSVRCIKD